jgi:hypothetical protein
MVLGVLCGCASAKPEVIHLPLETTALRDQVYELDTQPPDPKHADAVRVMRQLAAAVEQLPGDHRGAAGAIRYRAASIEHSRASALHSGDVRWALEIALAEIKSQPHPSRAIKPAAKEAREAVAQIDVNVPFLDQRAEIDRAFNRVAVTLMIATLPPSRARR